MMTEILIGFALAITGAILYFGYKTYVSKELGEEAVDEKEKYIPTTQDQLAMDYIRSGVVRLKSGGYRLLLELPSVNIELMEPEEREVVLQQYRQVLNAIDFQFQFLQQSRIVDVSEYLSTLEGFARTEKNPLIQKQVEYYTEFLVELIRDRSVLTKKFYLVVPFDEEKESKNKSGYQAEKEKRKKKEMAKKKKDKIDVQKEEEDEIYLEERRFEKARKILYSRGAMIERAFRRFDIAPKILNDEELLELFYTAYNKDRSVIQSLKNKDIDDFTSLRVKAKRRDRNEV
jgi:hypothetical protein